MNPHKRYLPVLFSLFIFLSFWIVSGLFWPGFVLGQATPSPSPSPSHTPTPAPPVTTSSISAQSVQGSNGWYTSAVTTTLTATGSSQIKNIRYWLDSNPVSTATGSFITQVYPQNGSHVLSYYASDINNHVENPAKTLNFKIDTVTPYNWRNFVAAESGNNHTFVFSMQVDDTTSGLDATKALLQYSVDDGATWGYYSSLTPCQSGTWQPNGWLNLSGLPFVSGAKTGVVQTPPIDVCNSNWNQCKIIRFKESDMAGNYSEKKICLNGAWMNTTGGDVFSVGNIDMDPTVNSSSTTFLSMSSGQITNFNSANNWSMPEYDRTSTLDGLEYAHLLAKLPNQINGIPSGKLPTTSGVYKVGGSLTINNSAIPAGFSTTQNVAIILLVEGKVTIDTNIDLPTNSVLLISSGDDIQVDKSVTSIDGIFVTNGIFDSSYNNGSAALVVNGSVYASGGFSLSRSLGYPDNNNTASELFNFQPSFMVNPKLSSMLYGERDFKWGELVDY